MNAIENADHSLVARVIRTSEPGSPPGHLDEIESVKAKINVVAYSAGSMKESEVQTADEARILGESFDVAWINVVGVKDVEILRQFGEVFSIHKLSLEDVAHTNQRAKFETFEDYNFYVTRMFTLKDQIQSEQLSILHCGKFVISFQEVDGDCLDNLRERIRSGKGYIRKRASDYLVYAIIDSVLDHYFPIVDWFGEKLDEQDAYLMEGGQQFSLATIQVLRRQLLEIGRWLRPNREMINQLMRDEAANMSPDTSIFVRDCYDHVNQLNESIENYRQVCSDLRDYHLSEVGNRTNEVMKTLTIVSAIFIPLSFIAGVYGMNFQYMPETQWTPGYFIVLGLMATVALSLVGWFYSRGWFSKK